MVLTVGGKTVTRDPTTRKLTTAPVKSMKVTVASPTPRAAPISPPAPTLNVTRVPDTPATAPTASEPTQGSGVFKAPFLSWAGQKERLANVGDVLSTVLNPFSKDKIVLPSGSPAPLLNSPIVRGALDVGLVVGTYNVGSALLGGVAGGAAATGTAATVGATGLRSLATAGAVGLGAGLLLGAGGSAETGPQTVTPTQSTNTYQTTTYNTDARTTNVNRYTIKGSPGASIGATTQGGAIIPGQNPGQSVTPTQTTTAEQTAESGSGISPLLLLGAALVLAVAGRD